MKLFIVMMMVKIEFIALSVINHLKSKTHINNIISNKTN